MYTAHEAEVYLREIVPWNETWLDAMPVYDKGCSQRISR